MSNTVMTVLGPVEADRLGSTLMHEHLIIDLCRVTRLPDGVLNEIDRIEPGLIVRNELEWLI